MTKEELQKIASYYSSEGTFIGYFLSEEKMNGIARQLNLTNKDGSYNHYKVERYFNISLTFIAETGSSFPEVEIYFLEDIKTMQN